jgi:hypothetical protein
LVDFLNFDHSYPLKALFDMSSFGVSDKTTSRSFRRLRTVCVMAVSIGALGSFALMLYTGRHNSSVLLILLFTVWVLSPFLALLVANFFSKRWAMLKRVTLYCLMLVITACSLVSYSGALSPPGTKPAFVFLIVPLISWLLMLVVFAIGSSFSRNVKK